jgi:hypothetical protein
MTILKLTKRVVSVYADVAQNSTKFTRIEESSDESLHQNMEKTALLASTQGETGSHLLARHMQA